MLRVLECGHASEAAFGSKRILPGKKIVFYLSVKKAGDYLVQQHQIPPGKPRAGERIEIIQLRSRETSQLRHSREACRRRKGGAEIQSTIGAPAPSRCGLRSVMAHCASLLRPTLPVPGWPTNATNAIAMHGVVHAPKSFPRKRESSKQLARKRPACLNLPSIPARYASL